MEKSWGHSSESEYCSACVRPKFESSGLQTKQLLTITGTWVNHLQREGDCTCQEGQGPYVTARHAVGQDAVTIGSGTNLAIVKCVWRFNSLHVTVRGSEDSFVESPFHGSRDQTQSHILPSHQFLSDDSFVQFVHLMVPRGTNEWWTPSSFQGQTSGLGNSYTLGRAAQISTGVVCIHLPFKKILTYWQISAEKNWLSISEQLYNISITKLELRLLELIVMRLTELGVYFCLLLEFGAWPCG